MTLDDLLNQDAQGQDAAPSAVAPQAQADPRAMLQQIFQRAQETDTRLAQVKAQPAPDLSAPQQDELDPMASDVLRGLFKSTMPPTGQQQQDNFGQMFRQSISPGREFLANLMNGLSAGFGGAKFRSVRDQAFERYATEQKLGLERQQLQQQAMHGVATIAQQMHEERGKMDLQRSLALYKGAQSDEQKQLALLKLDQSAQKMGLSAAQLLQKINTDESTAANKPQYSDKFYHAAELQTKAQYESAGFDPKSKEHSVSYQKDIQELATKLREEDLKARATINPPKEGKTPTPQINYVPDANGGYKVVSAGPGDTLPPGAVSQAGMSSLNVPTSATRSMIEKAPSVIEFVDKLGPQIDAAVKQLGPGQGRWSDFVVGKVGQKDLGLTRLRTNIQLLTTRLMNMHVGAKGSTEIMDHFKALIDSSKQDPENLKAALGEIRDYAETVRKEGGVADVRRGATPASTPTQRKPLSEIFK